MCFYQGGSYKGGQGGAVPLLVGKTKTTCSSSRNAQPRFASIVLGGVQGPLRLASHTQQCPRISGFPGATREARLKALDGRGAGPLCQHLINHFRSERRFSMEMLRTHEYGILFVRVYHGEGPHVFSFLISSLS